MLGPMLRYVGETEATVWVETDRECLVEILGRQARTFEVAGHHYGLVVRARRHGAGSTAPRRGRSGPPQLTPRSGGHRAWPAADADDTGT